ncbi:MAG TPA: hypothetical protein VD866_28090 [Urbifossiella sp.]|nr:hypothetical protein [Urbifossiella sp.]
MSLVADTQPGLRPGGFRPLCLGVIWPSKAWDDEDTTPQSVAEVLSPARASAEGFRHDALRVTGFLLQDRLDGQDAADFRALLRRHADRPTLPEDESVFEPEAPEGELEGVVPAGTSARDAFRSFTYWQMKKRAGVVGQAGVRAALRAVQEAFPGARVHLVGHSFGCKVMLAAVAGPGEPTPAPVQTLVLLQGAVSAEAMAERVPGTDSPGGYRAAVSAGRVDGPIVATFSRHDQACGRAYPLGSRVAGHVGELEGFFDRYLALGAVGPRELGAAQKPLLPMRHVGQPYGFDGPGVWGVDGGSPPGEFITGHSDIRTPQIAWLLWSAALRR